MTTDSITVRRDDGLLLTGLTAQSFCLFMLDQISRLKPSMLANDPECVEALEWIRQSDNPAIRAKAERLVPETYNGKGAA